MDFELLKRQEEGRVLKREDQLTDISQLPESVLTGQPTSDFKNIVKPQSYTHEESSDKASTMGSLSMDNVNVVPSGEGYYGSNNAAQDELLSRSPANGKRGSLEHLGTEEKSQDNSRTIPLKDQATAKISELREQAGAKMNDLREGYHNFGTQISEKIEAAKEQITNFNVKEASQHIKEQITEKRKDLKEGAKELYKEASEKYVEIKEQMEQKERELQQQAQELSSRASEKIDATKEQLEQRVEQKSPSKTEAVQGVKEQLNDKKEKLKEGLEGRREEIRQQAQNFSERASEKVGEIKEQFSESKEQIKQQAQDLSQKTIDKAEDIKQNIVEKGQELKQEGQNSLSQNHSSHHLSAESPSFTPSHEAHQQHHLSTDSQSFRPNQESHILIEAVKEGLGQSSGNLVEKVNEAEEQLQTSEGQNDTQRESAPAITKQWRQYSYKESAREWNQSIKEGRFELVNQPQIQQRQDFEAPSQESKKTWTNRWSQRRTQPKNQKKNQNKQKSQDSSQKTQEKKQRPRQQKQRAYQRRPQYVKVYQVKETSKKEEQIQSQPKSQEVQGETSEAPQFTRTESGSGAESQVDRERVPLLDVVQHKYQNYKSKISNVVHFFKGDKIAEGGDVEYKTSENVEGRPSEHASIKEKINEQSEKVSAQLSGQLQDVRAQVNQKASEQSDKLSGLIDNQLENAKTKFSKLSEKEVPAEETSVETSELQGQSLRSRVSSGLHNITSTISHSLEGVKERLHHGKEQIGSGLKEAQDSKEALSGKVKDRLNTASNELTEKVEGVKDKFKRDDGNEDAGEFHEVKDGFSETIDQLHKEQQVEEYSVPPHSDNPFDALIGEKNLVQPLKDSEIVGGNVQYLAEGIKDEDLIHQEITEEVQAKSGFLSKISANISNISHKITAKLPENIKHPFTSSEKASKENTDEYL